MAISYYVNRPFIVMREGPSLNNKVCSEALYSEQVQLLQERGDWWHIQTPDRYTGWVLKDQDSFILQQAQQFNAAVCRLSAHVYHCPDTEWGPITTLPLGSRIEIIDKDVEGSRWLKIRLINGEVCYIQQGDVDTHQNRMSLSEMLAFAERLPPLPYTWGGRCSLRGYDCSGLIQMLYGLMGIRLPRDSKDQIQWNGCIPCPLHEVSAGDLIFFGPQEGIVKHVALSLGNNRFLHTSPRENRPWIRTSSLSDSEWSGTKLSHYRAARKLL